MTGTLDSQEEYSICCKEELNRLVQRVKWNAANRMCVLFLSKLYQKFKNRNFNENRTIPRNHLTKALNFPLL